MLVATVMCTILRAAIERREGFPGDSDGKECACNTRELGSIPGLERSPGGGHGNSLQYSCMENPHGQRSLAGYGSWGGRDSDTTKHSTVAFPSKGLPR